VSARPVPVRQKGGSSTAAFSSYHTPPSSPISLNPNTQQILNRHILKNKEKGRERERENKKEKKNQFPTLLLQMPQA
jgi:hypothetical protein